MNDLKALAAQKAVDFQDLPEDSPELKTPTAEDHHHILVPEPKQVVQHAYGSVTASAVVTSGTGLKNSDGGSSTSESSLGSSSGYGSQNTVVRPEENNSHHPTLTAVHDGMKLLIIFLVFICFKKKY